MKVVGVIQARTGSMRLPGKVLAPVLGRPLIALMLERVARARTLDELVVAVPDGPADDELARVVAAAGHAVVRGPQDDVLARFVRALDGRSADVVVRLTADCPLHDPAVIDAAVESFLGGEPCDYLSNSLEPTFPNGLDVEVFTAAALARADAEATLPHEREHVTPFIDGSAGREAGFVRRGFANAGGDFSHLRWTVDEPADLELVTRVFEALYPAKPDFDWHDVLALLERHPELGRLNAGIRRDEGYERALAAEGRSRQMIRRTVSNASAA